MENPSLSSTEFEFEHMYGKPLMCRFQKFNNIKNSLGISLVINGQSHYYKGQMSANKGLGFRL